MVNNINRCRTTLQKVDFLMDVCGLSVINNLVNCVTKVCIGIYRRCESLFQEKNKKAFLGKHFEYIEKKDAFTCALGLVPVLGSLFIRIKNAYEKQRYPYVQPTDEISSTYVPPLKTNRVSDNAFIPDKMFSVGNLSDLDLMTRQEGEGNVESQLQALVDDVDFGDVSHENYAKYLSQLGQIELSDDEDSEIDFFKENT
jgi:hypothetical protein